MLVFDPSRVTDGIECSDDPVLRFRPRRLLGVRCGARTGARRGGLTDLRARRRGRAGVGGVVSGAGGRAAGAGAGRAGGDRGPRCRLGARGGRAVRRVLRDLDEILLPGVTHWQHPRYFAYFATSASAPAILAELLAATLNSVAILWRTAPAATELEGVVLRLGGRAARAARGLARPHRGQRLDLDAGRADRRPRGHRPRRWSSAPSRRTRRSTRRRGCSACACARSPCDAEFRLRADRLGDLQRGRGRGGHGGHDGEHVGRSGAGDRRRLRARPAPGCTSTPPTPARRWCAPSSAGRSPGVERADSVVVNAHKWMLTPMDCSLLWSRARRRCGPRSA